MSGRRYIRSLQIAVLLLLVIANSVYATENQPMSEEIEAEDQAEFNRLIHVLDKHTDIATKTRLNADHVPGIVTVLYSDDLEARGIQTIEEALTLVPGYNISTGRVENPEINVRGINEELFSGNVKIMLNSTSLNSPRTGGAIAILALPINQIERIEVIRGPASAVYGEYAYAGLINVVTRKTDNKAFVRYGSFDSIQGGGVFSWADPDLDLRVNGNFAGSSTGGAKLDAGADILHQDFFGLADISNSPGSVNESQENYSVGFTVEYKDFSLMTQFFERGTNDGFGAAEALPPRQDGERARQQIWITEARKKIEILPTLNAELNIGWREHDITVQNEFIFPPGFPGFPDGFIFGLSYDESEIRGGIDLNFSGLDDHTILIGWSSYSTEIDNAFLETNFVPSTGQPLPNIRRFRGTENFVDIGFSRFLNSVFIQDEYQIIPELTVTASLRYDVYDKLENNLSGRVAVVWRLIDEHVLKAQYGRAYRPPTFQELVGNNPPTFVGNPSLGTATIDTYEIGYIYDVPQTTAKATIFYSDLNDVIGLGGQGTQTFVNTEGLHIWGFELELEQKLIESLKFDANLSYSKTFDLDTRASVARSVEWLANAGLLYEPVNDVTLNLQYRYVGDRIRSSADTRGVLPGYHMLNFTGNVFNLGYSGITFRAGVKNVLDNRIIEPAPANTYARDYPRAGRWWWLQLEYQYH